MFVCLFVGVAGCATELEEEDVGEQSSAITVPAGLGRYCSKTHPGSGPNNWALAWGTGDPCGYIDDEAPGGTLQRSGLYSISGWNTVITRCTGSSARHHGNGNGPISAAFDWALGRASCIFTIAPRDIPIFDSPYDLSLGAAVYHNNGFDYARGFPINSQAIGGGGGTAEMVVDNDGQVHGGIDNHEGQDWNMDEGTEIYAVADGTVVLVREVWACGEWQKEVFIKHTVGSFLTPYWEQFVTYYAHLSAFDPDFPVGTISAPVSKGQVIGLSGDTGCSSPPHLHFGVFRLTNSADARLEALPFDPTAADITAMQENMIDPYGWQVSCGTHADCVDPWSHRVYPAGAISINLWAETPPSNW